MLLAHCSCLHSRPPSLHHFDLTLLWNQVWTIMMNSPDRSGSNTVNSSTSVVHRHTTVVNRIVRNTSLGRKSSRWKTEHERSLSTKTTQRFCTVNRRHASKTKTDSKLWNCEHFRSDTYGKLTGKTRIWTRSAQDTRFYCFKRMPKFVGACLRKCNAMSREWEQLWRRCILLWSQWEG